MCRSCLFMPHLQGTLSLCSAAPSQSGSLSGEGRAAQSPAGSFIHNPSPTLPHSLAFQLHSCPLGIQEAKSQLHSNTLTSAGRGFEAFPASLPFVVPPHPLLSLPTHKFTNCWKGANSIHSELESN